jgi:small subunit ribosomal protein S6
MNNYQVTIALRNSLDDKKRQSVIESISKSLQKVEKEDVWGSKGLAYPLSREDKAYYVHFEFQSDPEKISDLDKMLKLNEDVLRHLLIKRDVRVKANTKAEKAEKSGKAEKTKKSPEKEESK